MKQRADAAPAVSDGDLPVGQGGDAPAAQPLTQGDIIAMVMDINNNQFGGWFDPADVLAVIEIESSFRPMAYREEPALDDASYGLMQVLSSTARDRGYAGPVDGLFDPATNISIGMAQLKWSWDFLARKRGALPAESVWIGSYNAGVGNALKGFIPWAYVNKWTAARARWKGRV